MTSFNPTRRMGGQLAEVARHHQGMGRKAALARAVDRLRAVRITDPERRAHQYPHEFSGGMRQRAMIGMGLMGTPALIIADEPTTALDVTVQQQVLDLLRSIRDGRRRRAPADQPRRHRGRRGLRPGARHVRRPDRRGPARGRARDRARGTPTRARWSPPSPTWTPTSTGRSRSIPGRPVDPADVRPAAPTPPAARSPTSTAAPRTRRWRPTPPAAGSPAGTRASRSTSRSSELASVETEDGGGADERAALRRRHRPLRRAPTAVDGVSLTVPVGPGRRPGRRVRVRQVHAGPGRGRAGPDDERPDPARRRAGAARAAGARCRWSSRTRTPRSTRG